MNLKNHGADESVYRMFPARVGDHGFSDGREDGFRTRRMVSLSGNLVAKTFVMPSPNDLHFEGIN